MIGLSADGDRVYVRCMTDTVAAISSIAPVQEKVWVSNCGYGYDIDPSMPVEKDGTVFFSTKNGLVYALDARTGNVQWVHKVGVTIVNTVVPLDNRRVVATDLDGQIMLVEGIGSK